MKQLILFYAAIFFSGIASAQKLKASEVPVPVLTTFKKNFPAAKNVEWSKENENELEAEFKNGSVETAANFDTAGKWLIAETEIKKSQMPTTVQGTLKKEFAGYEAKEVEMAATPDNGTFYEVKLEKGKRTVTVQISKEGNVLKKEEAKEADEKGEGKSKNN